MGKRALRGISQLAEGRQSRARGIAVSRLRDIPRAARRRLSPRAAFLAPSTRRTSDKPHSRLCLDVPSKRGQQQSKARAPCAIMVQDFHKRLAASFQPTLCGTARSCRHKKGLAPEPYSSGARPCCMRIDAGTLVEDVALGMVGGAHQRAALDMP